MKKLIEELESASEALGKNPLISAAQCYGFNRALGIVRSHDPWISVEELPPVYEPSPDRSIEVLVLTDDGNIYTGVYVYEMKAFCIINRRSIAKDIKWTYLPEVQQ